VHGTNVGAEGVEECDGVAHDAEAQIISWQITWQTLGVVPISVQCRVLQVSISGYHEHFVRRASSAQRRHLSDDALLVHIKAIHAQTRAAMAGHVPARRCLAEASGSAKSAFKS
jgi:hypothetical protein